MNKKQTNECLFFLSLDLNWENPQLISEFSSILKHWIEIGVDGFRFTAASLISKRKKKKQT